MYQVWKSREIDLEEEKGEGSRPSYYKIISKLLRKTN